MSDLRDLAAVGSLGSDPLSATSSGSNAPSDASKQPPQSVVDAWNSALNAAKLDKAAQDAGWQPVSPKPWPAEAASSGNAPSAAQPPVSKTELSQEHGTNGWCGGKRE